MKARYTFLANDEDNKFKFFDIVQYLSNTRPYMTQNSVQQLGIFQDILSNYTVFIVFMAFKFFEWYFTRRNMRKDVNFGEKNMNLPPPKYITDEKNEKSANSSKNQCPICNKNIENAAFISTCQNAFCYKCILDHINKTGSCPETNIRLDSESVKRIYSS